MRNSKIRNKCYAKKNTEILKKALKTSILGSQNLPSGGQTPGPLDPHLFFIIRQKYEYSTTTPGYSQLAVTLFPNSRVTAEILISDPKSGFQKKKNLYADQVLIRFHFDSSISRKLQTLIILLFCTLFAADCTFRTNFVIL